MAAIAAQQEELVANWTASFAAFTTYSNWMTLYGEVNGNSSEEVSLRRRVLTV